MNRPRISVVLPTYERRELVTAAVAALNRQSFDQPYEVIVAVDGSTDGTAEALRAMACAAPITVLEQANAGAAAARNLGARQARGEIILFLDDDMEADPNLLAEHDRTHREGADAVLGHLPLHVQSTRNVISQAVGDWAEARSVRLSRPAAALDLHDLLTGQISVSAEVFRKVGGFDAAFTQDGSFGNEDIDFGQRLLRGGYDVRFNGRAVSRQRYEVSPRSHLRQWRQAGQADVLFAGKHPEEGLSLFVLNGLRTRFARFVARPLARLPLWEGLMWLLRPLAVWAGSGQGRLAAAVFFRIRELEYWRGVEEAGGVPAVRPLRVLAYHALSDLSDSGVLRGYGVPLEQFRTQIACLKRAGFRFIGPKEFAAFVEGRGGLPRRALLVTFDDCYADLPLATPVLQAAKAGAIAFAVSGRLGGENAWDRDYGGPPLKLLDAQGLRSLQASGFEIGAHSRTHPILPRLEAAEIEAEVSGSIADLEAVGLARPRFFAFPYGESDERVRAAARGAGIRAAFEIRTGLMAPGGDLLRIPRVEVMRGDTGLRLLAKVQFARELGAMARLMEAGRAYLSWIGWAARRLLRKARAAAPVSR